LGPFRYLTIWALLMSFFCASRMLAITERRSTRQWEPVVATAAVLDAMVVYLYWSLYFQDPALVRSGVPNPWVEYYMHLGGPVLQWLDALIVWRGFRRYPPAAGVVMLVVPAYVGWAELVLQPLSNRPVGLVTQGLPYPFLNDMETGARLRYYAVLGVAALGLLAVVLGFSAVARRVGGVLKPA